SFDHPYGRQQQSPPDRYQSKQYYNSGGPDSGADGEGEDDDRERQLSDRYSRIQLVDHCNSMPPVGQVKNTAVSSSVSQLQSYFYSGVFLEYVYNARGASCASTTNTMTISLAAAGGCAGSSTNFAPMEKRPATKICRVCGDKAYSYNFNVITCESCKAFFRRNANKEKEIRCPFNEQCDINTVSRRFCQRCRLQKCFRVGMKKEWIMSDEARLEKKQRIQENRERRAAAAAAVASVNAALGLGGQMGGSAAVLKHSTEMDQQELALTQQQTRKSIKQEQPLLQSDSITTASFLQTQQQTQAAQRVEMLQVEALHTEQQQQQLVPQLTHQQEVPNPLVTDLPSNPLAGLQNPFTSPAAAPLLNTQTAGTEQVMAAAKVAAAAQVAAVQQVLAALANQSLNANNAFLTPGSTTNAQNENVNQQLQQVANVFSTGTIQNNNQQPPNISSQIVTPAPSTNILPSCFIEVAAAHLASQPQQTPQQPSIPPPPNPNMSIGTGGGQLNNNNCTPPQQNTSSIQQQQQQTITSSISTNQSQSQNLLQCQQFPTQQAQQQQQPIHPQYLEMVSIPKDILLKLVEQRIESDKTQIQPPSKCLCHCHCGRYPNDVPIVDKVMTDLLEGSSKHLGGGDNNSTSSNNSTPRNSLQSQPVHFHLLYYSDSRQLIIFLKQGGASFSIASSLHQLSASDQEQLAELSKANEIWKTSATTSSNISLTSGGAQSGDLQFLMGHYTESDLRRLIGLAKSLDAFKRLDQHDQERCFGSFFVLRSVLSVEVNEFTVAILRQNGVPESTIRFYVDFPVEWRRNEIINLLLGLILLFNVEVADLQSAISVTVENMKFQSLLKRLLYAFCDRDSVKAETVAAELLARVEHLKQLFPGGTPTTHNSLGIGTCNNLAFAPQTIGQQQQIVSTSQLVECSNSSININTTHPGGDAMLKYAGKDISIAINNVVAHGFSREFIENKLSELYIGKIK
uniref:Nuclear receptor domain-containing protein n=1 Tax=Meloidogyne javanica TaxID=6303 RepID=A0A915NET8_MELJA